MSLDDQQPQVFRWGRLGTVMVRSAMRLSRSASMQRARADTLASQIRLVAKGQPQPMAIRNIREIREQGAFFLGRRIPPLKIAVTRCRRHVARGLAIHLGARYHHFIDRTPRRAAEPMKVFPVPGGRSEGTEHDGIVAPDGDPGSKDRRDRPDVIHRPLGIDRRRVQDAGIAGDRILDDERQVGAAHRLQGTEERFQVSCPEDEPVDGGGRERHDADLSAVGIDGPRKPRFQALHEPRSVESGNVGSVTRRDDHRAAQSAMAAPSKQRSPLSVIFAAQPEDSGAMIDTSRLRMRVRVPENRGCTGCAAGAGRIYNGG